jgi:hypothetical protein
MPSMDLDKMTVVVLIVSISDLDKSRSIKTQPRQPAPRQVCSSKGDRVSRVEVLQKRTRNDLAAEEDIIGVHDRSLISIHPYIVLSAFVSPTC